MRGRCGRGRLQRSALVARASLFIAVHYLESQGIVVPQSHSAALVASCGASLIPVPACFARRACLQRTTCFRLLRQFASELQVSEAGMEVPRDSG